MTYFILIFNFAYLAVGLAANNWFVAGCALIGVLFSSMTISARILRARR